MKNYFFPSYLHPKVEEQEELMQLVSKEVAQVVNYKTEAEDTTA